MNLPTAEPPNPFKSFAELVAEQHEIARQAPERMLKLVSGTQDMFKSVSVQLAEQSSEFAEQWAQVQKGLDDARREFDERIHSLKRSWLENPDPLGAFIFEPGGDSED